MPMNTPENLSVELNALNEAFKQSEEYLLIQKIQMQSTAVSSADKNRIKESILNVYSKLFLSISLDRNMNIIVTCVLSSMQFTSATISQILNMEDSSVRSLKHRLKKKMDPEHEGQFLKIVPFYKSLIISTLLLSGFILCYLVLSKTACKFACK